MIIGLTGSLASGKGIVSKFLKEKGFVYLSLSDELREIAKEEKIELTRENLQNLGNKLREEKGKGVLAEVVSSKIINQTYKKAIVDGIRNPAEVEVLRKLKDFFLISVDAPQEIRFKRIVERGRESDPKTWEDFLRVDDRDKGLGEAPTGQAVGKCMELADYSLTNSGTPEDIKERIKNLYLDLERKIPRPIWDEYFIAIMKSVAKRSTCDRGRSGCVIVKDKQILTTGYVGSPSGLPHCDEVGHLIKEIKHEDGRTTKHCLRTSHAEQSAICQAAKMGIPIKDSTLYCQMTPCPTCAKMIINSGIKRVVCENHYHAEKETLGLFKNAGIKLEVLNDEVQKYFNQ